MFAVHEMVFISNGLSLTLLVEQLMSIMLIQILISLGLWLLVLSYCIYAFREQWSTDSPYVSVDGAVQYAGFWHRAYAALLDSIVVLFPISILEEEFLILEREHFLYWLIVTMIYLVYKVVAEYKFGQTLGKKWAGIKVVNKSNDHISFTQSLIRYSIYLPIYLAKLVILFVDPVAIFGTSDTFPMNNDGLNFMFIVLILIAVLFVSFTKYKQGLHDLIVKTYVIEKQTNEKREYFSRSVLIAIAFLLMSIPFAKDSFFEGYNEGVLNDRDLELIDE